MQRWRATEKLPEPPVDWRRSDGERGDKSPLLSEVDTCRKKRTSLA